MGQETKITSDNLEIKGKAWPVQFRITIMFTAAESRAGSV